MCSKFKDPYFTLSDCDSDTWESRWNCSLICWKRYRYFSKWSSFFLFQSGNFRIFKFQNAQRSADYCFEFGYFILVHFEPDFNHLSCMFQKSHFRATNHNQSPKCKCGTTGNKPRIRCWTIREIVSLWTGQNIDKIFISGPYQCRILYIIMPFTTRTQGKILSPPKCKWAKADA